MLNDTEWGLSGHLYLPISVRRQDGGFDTRFFVARGPKATIEEAPIVVTSGGRAASLTQPLPGASIKEPRVGNDRLQRDLRELERAGWRAVVRESDGRLLLQSNAQDVALWFVLPPEYPISAPDVYVEDGDGVRPIPLADLPELASWSSLRSLTALAEQARKSVDDLRAVESHIIRPRAFPLVRLVRSVRIPFMGAR
jgi:hypothetical protein